MRSHTLGYRGLLTVVSFAVLAPLAQADQVPTVNMFKDYDDNNFGIVAKYRNGNVEYVYCCQQISPKDFIGLTFVVRAGVLSHKVVAENVRDVASIKWNDITLRDGTHYKAMGQPQFWLCEPVSPNCALWAGARDVLDNSVSYMEKNLTARPASYDASRHEFVEVPSFMRPDQFLTQAQLLQAPDISIAVGEDYAKIMKIRADAADYARSILGPAVDAAQRKQAAANAASKAAREQMMTKREEDATLMRKTIRVGTETNCGTVFDVRLPMVGIQTTSGMQFVRLDRLYASDAGCVFKDGQYAGPSPIPFY